MRHNQIDKRADTLIAALPDGDDLLSTPQLAEQLGVSVQFLTIGRCRNWGPKYLKLGQRVRYHPDDVRDWLQERRHATTQEYPHHAGPGRGHRRNAAD
jgi:hypothetical protein